MTNGAPNSRQMPQNVTSAVCTVKPPVSDGERHGV